MLCLWGVVESVCLLSLCGTAGDSCASTIKILFRNFRTANLNYHLITSFDFCLEPSNISDWRSLLAFPLFLPRPRYRSSLIDLFGSLVGEYL